MGETIRGSGLGFYGYYKSGFTVVYWGCWVFIRILFEGKILLSVKFEKIY